MLAVQQTLFHALLIALQSSITRKSLFQTLEILGTCFTDKIVIITEGSRAARKQEKLIKKANSFCKLPAALLVFLMQFAKGDLVHQLNTASYFFSFSQLF